MVGHRKRKIIKKDEFLCNNKNKSITHNLKKFFSAVENGDDLTPYLSLLAKKRGFRTQENVFSPTEWEHKDFILNVFSLHHFHLGMKMVDEHIERTNEVLFAHVTRETLVPIAVLDHNVFDMKTVEMNQNRQALWSLAKAYEGNLGGITAAGTPTQITRGAQNINNTLKKFDQKLNSNDWIIKNFKPEGKLSSVKPKFWFCHLDFGIMDTQNNVFIKLINGPN